MNDPLQVKKKAQKPTLADGLRAQAMGERNQEEVELPEFSDDEASFENTSGQTTSSSNHPMIPLDSEIVLDDRAEYIKETRLALDRYKEMIIQLSKQARDNINKLVEILDSPQLKNKLLRLIKAQEGLSPNGSENNLNSTLRDNIIIKHLEAWEKNEHWYHLKPGTGGLREKLATMIKAKRFSDNKFEDNLKEISNEISKYVEQNRKWTTQRLEDCRYIGNDILNGYDLLLQSDSKEQRENNLYFSVKEKKGGVICLCYSTKKTTGDTIEGEINKADVDTDCFNRIEVAIKNKKPQDITQQDKDTIFDITSNRGHTFRDHLSLKEIRQRLFERMAKMDTTWTWLTGKKGRLWKELKTADGKAFLIACQVVRISTLKGSIEFDKLNKGFDTYLNKIRNTLIQENSRIDENDDEVLKLLIQKRISDKHGYTLLHYCAMHNNDSFAQKIIERYLLENNEKVYLDLQDNNGNTALHIAARQKHHKVIETFLENEADWSIPNHDHKTPSMIAQESHSSDCIMLFDNIAKAQRINRPKEAAPSSTTTIAQQLTQPNGMKDKYQAYQATLIKQNTLKAKLGVVLTDYQIQVHYARLEPSDHQYEDKKALYRCTLQLVELYQSWLAFDFQNARLSQPKMTFTANKKVKIKGSTVNCSIEKAIGDGWCAFHAAGLKNPEFGFQRPENVINNLLIALSKKNINERIVDCLVKSLEGSYRNQDPENPMILNGNDKQGVIISTRMFELYNAIQKTADGNSTEQANNNWRNYLGKAEVLSSYVQHILQNKYADVNFVQACLIAEGKPHNIELFVDYNSPTGELVSLAGDEVDYRNPNTIFLLYRPGLTLLTAHYDRIILPPDEQMPFQPDRIMLPENLEKNVNRFIEESNKFWPGDELPFEFEQTGTQFQIGLSPSSSKPFSQNELYNLKSLLDKAIPKTWIHSVTIISDKLTIEVKNISVGNKLNAFLKEAQFNLKGTQQDLVDNVNFLRRNGPKK